MNPDALDAEEQFGRGDEAGLLDVLEEGEDLVDLVEPLARQRLRDLDRHHLELLDHVAVLFVGHQLLCAALELVGVEKQARQLRLSLSFDLVSF